MSKRIFSVLAAMIAVSLFAALQPTQAQGPSGNFTNGPGPYFSDPQATDDHCGYTDETTSGPYYIAGVPEGENINYQNLPGEPLTISGIVYDGSTGKPIPNAQITAWQVDAEAKYWPAANGDASKFDKKQLNLRGTVKANDKGEYRFTTIKPAIYEGRRRHIHYYIVAPGYISTFTQTYWKDDPTTSDSTDRNTETCRVLTFEKAKEGSGTVGTFNIYLRPDPKATAAPTAAATQAAAAKFTLLNLNTATNEQILAIPNMNNRMLREFLEYRPYISITQFRREMGKYIKADQIAGYEKYIYVPIKIDSSDAASLKQIPGVDDKIAADVIAGRPYKTNDVFLAKLAKSLTPEQVAFAKNYLEAQAQ